MWTKGNWNIINLTLTLTRYYLYSNDLHVVMEWCPQKWNSQIEDTILLYSINEGKSSGSLHNLTWAYHHNEDILSCFDTDFVSQMKLTKLPLIRCFDGDLILMRSDTVWVEPGLLTKRWSQNKNKAFGPYRGVCMEGSQMHWFKTCIRNKDPDKYDYNPHVDSKLA